MLTGHNSSLVLQAKFLLIHSNMHHLSDVIKQKSYEQIVYLLRRHPITFLPHVFLFVILTAIPIVMYIFLSTYFPALFNDPIYFPLLVLSGSIYMLSILLFFYTEFIIFYLDIWIVTNDRIVDIEQHGLFSRSTSELDLFRIQDVTSDTHGLIATIFKYGTVTVKTASNNVHIIFRDVKNPDKIREDLIHYSDIDRKFHLGTEKLDEH